MHTKPDLRVFLKWMVAGSGSVITDVIPLGRIDEDFHICSFGCFRLCLHIRL